MKAKCERRRKTFVASRPATSRSSSPSDAGRRHLRSPSSFDRPAAPRVLAESSLRSYIRTMERGVIVRGRLHGRRIDLDESVEELEGEVEIVVRPVEAGRANTVESDFEFMRSLSPGTRTKDDIDRQITEERNPWGDR